MLKMTAPLTAWVPGRAPLLCLDLRSAVNTLVSWPGLEISGSSATALALP